MRALLICSFFFYLATAEANIESSPGDEKRPSRSEIAENRSCFQELSSNGCEDPGINLKEFRVCLHEVFPKLSENCRRMMSNLYHRRD